MFKPLIFTLDLIAQSTTSYTGINKYPDIRSPWSVRFFNAVNYTEFMIVHQIFNQSQKVIHKAIFFRSSK